MADMQAASTLLVIPAIGGTAATRIKYDGDGSRVAIWRRLDNGPWARLNLVGLALAENPALEPAEAARADRKSVV